MTYQIDIRDFKSFPPFKKRFLSYFPKNAFKESHEDCCWNWQGSLNANYGEIWYGRERYNAHRMSYIVFNGPVRADQLVRHTCDNKFCVNPKHLILGNQADNMIDMVKRQPRNTIILNEEAVKVIKWMLKYQPKRGLAAKLARLHGVVPETIYAIKARRNWSWVKI